MKEGGLRDSNRLDEPVGEGGLVSRSPCEREEPAECRSGLHQKLNGVSFFVSVFLSLPSTSKRSGRSASATPARSASMTCAPRRTPPPRLQQTGRSTERTHCASSNRGSFAHSNAFKNPQKYLTYICACLLPANARRHRRKHHTGRPAPPFFFSSHDHPNERIPGARLDCEGK
ncbi:hypothetical protein LZ30DRAFT_209365 [Colletotrichum cereale]|nr:hypothetical protein LZ30DRAFT_209365 [Colletotrichum cereale]